MYTEKCDLRIREEAPWMSRGSSFQSLGLGPTKITFNFESDPDHSLDTISKLWILHLLIIEPFCFGKER